MKIDRIYVIWHREEYRKEIEKRLIGIDKPITYVGPEPDSRDPNFPKWLYDNGYKCTENWKTVKDGEEIDKAFGSFWARDIRSGEIACTISHIEAWKEAKKDKSECALFLEQDAIVSKDNGEFKDVIPKIEAYMAGMNHMDWDMLYAGMCGNPIVEDTDFFWLQKTIWSYCLHSYILTSRGIDIVLDSDIEQNLVPVDEYVPALYSPEDNNKIHPNLKYLHGRLKAYNITRNEKGHSLIQQSNGHLKLVGIEEYPDGVSDTEHSPLYVPYESKEYGYPELIVIDDFVKDEKLLHDIDNDEEFWKLGFNWWDGWWQSPTVSNRHKLIEYIYKDNCPFPIHQEDGGPGHGHGFEHWVGITSDESPFTKLVFGEEWALNPHQDKDEDYWASHPQGKNRGDHPDSFRTPLLGTVYYTEAPEEGGEIQIWDEKDFHSITPDTPYEIIKAKRNRLIIFDASKIHAVRKIKKGKRKAIAINLWEPRPVTEMIE